MVQEKNMVVVAVAIVIAIAIVALAVRLIYRYREATGRKPSSRESYLLGVALGVELFGAYVLVTLLWKLVGQSTLPSAQVGLALAASAMYLIQVFALYLLVDKHLIGRIAIWLARKRTGTSHLSPRGSFILPVVLCLTPYIGFLTGVALHAL